MLEHFRRVSEQFQKCSSGLFCNCFNRLYFSGTIVEKFPITPDITFFKCPRIILVDILNARRIISEILELFNS